MEAVQNRPSRGLHPAIYVAAATVLTLIATSIFASLAVTLSVLHIGIGLTLWLCIVGRPSDLQLPQLKTQTLVSRI